MGIREFIRQAREERGWSVREAAKQCHISATRFSEVFETGTSRNTGKPTAPNYSLLVKVSRGFSIPLQILLEVAGLAAASTDEHLESELVQAWRNLSPANRLMALEITRTMLRMQGEAFGLHPD